MSIISDRSTKSIFIHVTKCAGLSVAQWYGDSFGRENVESCLHAPVRYFKEDRGLTDYYTWTIVRNPYDRALSWYYHQGDILKTAIMFTGENNVHNVATWFMQEIATIDYRKPKYEYLEATLINKQEELDAWNKGFDHWLERYAETSTFEPREFYNFVDPEADRFKFKTNQTWWITDSDNRFDVDKIIRFENLKKEFRFIAKKLNSNIQLSTINQSVKSKKVSVGHDSKKIIENMFKDDFERLNY